MYGSQPIATSFSNISQYFMQTPGDELDQMTGQGKMPDGPG